MDMSEAELIEQARQGDAIAFRRIYEATSGFVFNVALRITGRTEEAEEVTQDVFIAAHRALGSFRGQSALKTWLYRITVNRSLNKVKSAAGRRREVPYEEYMDTPQDTMPDAPLIAGDISRKVQAMLDTLAPEFRACVVLREIEGLSYEAIAQALNININTVRTRISRARRQLAETARQGGSYDM